LLKASVQCDERNFVSVYTGHENEQGE